MKTASAGDKRQASNNSLQQSTTSKVSKKRPSKRNKTDTNYWREKIFRLSYPSEGKTKFVGHYSVKIQHKGRRELFPLHTNNRDAAAVKARDIYLSLIGKGLDATLSVYKPATEHKDLTTVGELVQAMRATSTGKSRTIEQYRQKLYQIVSQCFDIDSSGKYDLRGEGNDQWLQRVESVRLAALTTDRIIKWKSAYLKAAGDSPVKQRAAKTSVNAILRQARALFAPKYLEHTSFKQIQNPFTGIKLEPRQSTLYKSKINAEALIADALKELKEEELKAFLLALTCGLRRNEIDALTWSNFQWDQQKLILEASEHFGGKSESSLGEVFLDPELLSLFRGYRAKARSESEFVLRSANQPKPGAMYAHYRARLTFKRLNDWLRLKKVAGRNPLHTLRKEYGSLVCQKFGLYAASRALRHRNIQTTTAHYLDMKTRATAGLGHLLGPPENVVPIEPDDLKQPEALREAEQKEVCRKIRISDK